MDLTELGSMSNRGWNVRSRSSPRRHCTQIELNRFIEPKGRSRIADPQCDLRHNAPDFVGEKSRGS
jgi:hypothetical protein